MAETSLILGTRGSRLALWQAHHVQARLEAAGINVTIREVRTTGDRILDVPLAKIGDKGLFTKELDVALLAGDIHLAVHSLKDLPTRISDGITLAAVSSREEPWDAFVAHPAYAGSLADLPEGAILGTSSLRRQAQLLAWRPSLRIEPLRGNVDTRLAKLEASGWHGAVLATAGLLRLGLEYHIRERIPTGIMLPAVGQGALGIVCASADESTQSLLRRVLHDEATAACTRAERAFLRRLEGGCQVPIGAHGRIESGLLQLESVIASTDGRFVFRGEVTGTPDEAESLGTSLAEALLAQGADRVLGEIRNTSGSGA